MHAHFDIGRKEDRMERLEVGLQLINGVDVLSCWAIVYNAKIQHVLSSGLAIGLSCCPFGKKWVDSS